jgi:phosphatidylethanolamine-binding protein (PEBP) family uncharacterized protein
MIVTYNGKNITNEKFMTKDETQSQPKVKYTASPEKIYTLIMYDPNAVSPTNNHLHWVVVNIPGNKIDSGKKLFEYKGPNPPSGSGIHHYIFEILEQESEITLLPFLENERTLSMEELYKRLNLEKENSIYTIFFCVNSQKGGKNKKQRKTRKTRKTRKNKKNKKNKNAKSKKF